MRRCAPWICMVVLNFLAVLRSGLPSLRCLITGWPLFWSSSENDCRGACTHIPQFISVFQLGKQASDVLRYTWLASS